MSITVTFHDDLAERLETEAMKQQISVEKLVTTILDRALSRTPDCWGAQNQRRLALIRKSIQQTLTADEQEELRILQAVLDAWFEEFDAGLQVRIEPTIM